METGSMADPAGGKPSILAHTEEIRRGLRRVVFMSKGAAISAAGVFMGWTAGFGSSWTAFPSLRPYIVAAYGAGCGGLVFLSFSLRRRRAQADCRVEMERKATARERLGLWLGIPLGVAGVIVLNLSLPRTLVPTWLGPASLILFLLLAGGYFLHLALEVRLFELAIMGVAFGILGLPTLYVYRVPIPEETLEKLLIAILGIMGMLQLALGASLHRRWAAWRTQVLAAGTENSR